MSGPWLAALGNALLRFIDADPSLAASATAAAPSSPRAPPGPPPLRGLPLVPLELPLVEGRRRGRGGSGDGGGARGPAADAGRAKPVAGRALPATGCGPRTSSRSAGTPQRAGARPSAGVGGCGGCMAALPRGFRAVGLFCRVAVRPCCYVALGLMRCGFVWLWGFGAVGLWFCAAAVRQCGCADVRLCGCAAVGPWF